MILSWEYKGWVAFIIIFTVTIDLTWTQEFPKKHTLEVTPTFSAEPANSSRTKVPAIDSFMENLYKTCALALGLLSQNLNVFFENHLLCVISE